MEDDDEQERQSIDDIFQYPAETNRLVLSFYI